MVYNSKDSKENIKLVSSIKYQERRSTITVCRLGPYYRINNCYRSAI